MGEGGRQKCRTVSQSSEGRPNTSRPLRLVGALAVGATSPEDPVQSSVCSFVLPRLSICALPLAATLQSVMVKVSIILFKGNPRYAPGQNISHCFPDLAGSTSETSQHHLIRLPVQQLILPSRKRDCGSNQTTVNLNASFEAFRYIYSRLSTPILPIPRIFNRNRSPPCSQPFLSLRKSLLLTSEAPFTTGPSILMPALAGLLEPQSNSPPPVREEGLS